MFLFSHLEFFLWKKQLTCFLGLFVRIDILNIGLSAGGLTRQGPIVAVWDIPRATRADACISASQHFSQFSAGKTRVWRCRTNNRCAYDDAAVRTCKKVLTFIPARERRLANGPARAR